MQKSSKNSNWKWVPGTGLRDLGKKATNTEKNLKNGTNLDNYIDYFLKYFSARNFALCLSTPIQRVLYKF